VFELNSDLNVYEMQGEGDVGEYEPEMVVVGEVSMSITMAELMLEEEMKNESNSYEVQRTLPVQLKMHGLFLEASLSVCSNHRIFFNFTMNAAPLFYFS